jgi:hypothetical protein
MVELTFLEVHFEDADLTANAPYSYGETDDAPSEGPTASGSRGGTILALLVGLVFSVALAYLARKKVFGGDNGDGDGEGSDSVPDLGE